MTTQRVKLRTLSYVFLSCCLVCSLLVSPSYVEWPDGMLMDMYLQSSAHARRGIASWVSRSQLASLRVIQNSERSPSGLSGWNEPPRLLRFPSTAQERSPLEVSMVTKCLLFVSVRHRHFSYLLMTYWKYDSPTGPPHIRAWLFKRPARFGRCPYRTCFNSKRPGLKSLSQQTWSLIGGCGSILY